MSAGVARPQRREAGTKVQAWAQYHWVRVEPLVPRFVTLVQLGARGALPSADLEGVVHSFGGEGEGGLHLEFADSLCLESSVGVSMRGVG